MNPKAGFAEVFSPLKNRNLSIYLSGQTVSLFGSMMQSTAQSWVVWQISHSARDLGLVAAVGALPMLALGAFGGVMADRLDRRKLLVATQVASMLLAFIFAFLLVTGWIQIWQIYILSALLGIVSAADMPAQTAFIGDLSGIQQVRQAVVLNGMIGQLSRTIGPALAGWVIGAFGTAPAFWLNGASFLAVIGSLLMVRAQQVRYESNSSSGNAMGEAFRYIAKEERAQDMLLACVCITLFVFSAGQLLPAIVTDFLHGGPEMLGILLGATGAGALTSALLLVPLVQSAPRPGWVISGALVLMGAWLALVVSSHLTWFWIISMFFVSMGAPVVITTAEGLLQVMAPPDMRARLLSVWMMITFGMMPFGFLIVGFTGQALGAPLAILLNGIVLVLAGCGLLALRPALWTWRPTPVSQFSVEEVG